MRTVKIVRATVCLLSTLLLDRLHYFGCLDRLFLRCSFPQEAGHRADLLRGALLLAEVDRTGASGDRAHRNDCIAPGQMLGLWLLRFNLG